MPFGGGDIERRRAILNFSRLRYIIENHCDVVPHGPCESKRRRYEVAVARTLVDDIPKNALAAIDKADILIALLSERNHTVAYELGFRRAREREKSAILVGDSRENFPIYESKVEYLNWTQANVFAEIDRIVDAKYPVLPDFRAEIPETLKQVIDAEDGRLIKELQLSLQEIENKIIEPSSDPVQKLLGTLSDRVNRFYPCSVVEVKFSARSEFEDPAEPASVIAFDPAFSSLYGYGSKMAAERDTPFTLDRLLKRIERFSDPNDWEEFMQEQIELTATVIKDYGHVRVTVPIKINASHPDGRYKSRWFLPCMIGQVIEGSLSGAHRMYLLIAYIEVPKAIAVGIREDDDK